MIWFIFGLLLLVGVWIAVFVTDLKFIGIVGSVVAAGLILVSCIYTQDVGEALVLKNADGTIAREDTTAGMDMKAPWQDTISFDIKGQQALYKLDGKATAPNEKVDGPEITVTTSDKVPSNVDIAVRYSIRPDRVSEIYTTYKTEENLEQRLISQDIKSVIRDAAGSFTVDTLMADRTGYAKKIDDLLKSKWDKEGIIVDSVALQAIRPPQSILDRINASQVAQQGLVQAQANTKVKEEEARQKVIEAKGVADANNILNSSLTDNVLKDKYIAALQNAKSLVVVPNGSTPMVGIPESK